jgi:hypothetical protein
MFLTTREPPSCFAGAPTSVWHRSLPSQCLSQRFPETRRQSDSRKTLFVGGPSEFIPKGYVNLWRRTNRSCRRLLAAGRPAGRGEISSRLIGRTPPVLEDCCQAGTSPVDRPLDDPFGSHVPFVQHLWGEVWGLGAFSGAEEHSVTETGHSAHHNELTGSLRVTSAGGKRGANGLCSASASRP